MDRTQPPTYHAPIKHTSNRNHHKRTSISWQTDRLNIASPGSQRVLWLQQYRYPGSAGQANAARPTTAPHAHFNRQPSNAQPVQIPLFGGSPVRGQISQQATDLNQITIAEHDESKLKPGMSFIRQTAMGDYLMTPKYQHEPASRRERLSGLIPPMIGRLKRDYATSDLTGNDARLGNASNALRIKRSHSDATDGNEGSPPIPSYSFGDLFPPKPQGLVSSLGVGGWKGAAPPYGEDSLYEDEVIRSMSRRRKSEKPLHDPNSIDKDPKQPQPPSDQPMDNGGPPFGNIDGDPNGFDLGLNFGDDAGALENFDFDSFLHTGNDHDDFGNLVSDFEFPLSSPTPVVNLPPQLRHQQQQQQKRRRETREQPRRPASKRHTHTGGPLDIANSNNPDFNNFFPGNDLSQNQSLPSYLGDTLDPHLLDTPGGGRRYVDDVGLGKPVEGTRPLQPQDAMAQAIDTRVQSEDKFDVRLSSMTSNQTSSSTCKLRPSNLKYTISEDHTIDISKRRKAHFIALEQPARRAANVKQLQGQSFKVGQRAREPTKLQ